MKEDNIESTITTREDEQIRLKPFFKTLLRYKLIIAFITAISTIISIKNANSLDPVYKGSFEILVTRTQSNISTGASLDSIIKNRGTQSSGKTQELILKSPLVLNPIFNYVLQNYSQRGIDTKNMTYKGWVNNELEIQFKEDSQVLAVTYFNEDKEFIKDVLNKISKKYQDYSQSDREEELNKTIKYLEEQSIIYRKKALQALQELNKFSIENGMGDIGGEIALGTNNQSSENNLNNEKGPQRFARQFALLESYESKYIDYSYKLKDDSKILKDLKLRIENLRASLKRPNEIILKFRELKNSSNNKYSTLKNIELQLSALKLERAKQLDTWRLISDPTIEKRKVYPNKTNIVVRTFLISLIVTSSLAILYDKLKGNLYDYYEIKKNISCKYLGNLYYDDSNLSSTIFNKILNNNNNNNKNSKIGLLSFTDKNNDFIENFEDKNSKLEILDNVDYLKDNMLKSFDNLFLIIESGKINLKDIIYINKYINAYDDKFKGWFFIDT